MASSSGAKGKKGKDRVLKKSKKSPEEKSKKRKQAEEKVEEKQKARRSDRVKDKRKIGIDLPPSDGPKRVLTGQEHKNFAAWSGFHVELESELKKELDADSELEDVTKRCPHIQTLGTKLSGAKGEFASAKDESFVKHSLDDSGRTTLSVGRIVGPQKRGKGTTPDAKGRLVGDDRGHLVQEDGVADVAVAQVNTTANIVAENAVINQQYKTSFERVVKDYAAKNPDKVVHTVHQPFYTGEEVRPTKIAHYAIVDGTVKTAVVFENPLPEKLSMDTAWNKT